MALDPIKMMDIWFAWHPVRLGALSTGRMVWLRRVLRIDYGALSIYQPIGMAPDHLKAKANGQA